MKMEEESMGFNKRECFQAVSAIMGLVVGDALGVPVEFKSRDELKENPVDAMIGYGTHNQPPGTWSDDSSMVIATMEWLGELMEFPCEEDYKLLMDKFSNWLLYGDYTPYGEIFDCGISTNRAIMSYGKGIEPVKCGGTTDYDNGNGSLMRILPAAISFRNGLAFQKNDRADLIFHISALTHAHARSKIGCLIYSKLIASMMYLSKEGKMEIVEKSLRYSKDFLEKHNVADISYESKEYGRLWDLKSFKELNENEIKSSGYVVDTLEAAIWCFLNTDSYAECVLKAVNLGQDTDTVGAVAGGIAGLYYGYENIPKKWLAFIPKREWIEELATKMLPHRR